MSNKIDKLRDFPGYGGKRPLLYIPPERLFLDPQNPRLPLEAQGKDETKIKESLRKSYLDELAHSMAKNGYFDEEPLVAIPKDLPDEFLEQTYDELKDNKQYSDLLLNPTTEFIVVEGNRRLCTVKLLLSGEVSSYPQIDDGIRIDLGSLPVIIYPKRKDVIAYLGVRHIIGVKKWDAYAKARYIASMKENFGLTIDEIQNSVGDTSNSARKTYVCYRLIEVIENEYEFYDTSKAKDNFSYLMLALGQGSVKDFLGLPKQWSNIDFENFISPDKIENAFYLFSWLFGEGKEKPKVVEESRDITGKLTSVLRDASATIYLKEFRVLEEAYERCGGESMLLIKFLKRANRDLGRSLPLVEKYYNEEVEIQIQETERLIETINKIKK
ncbi:MAG: hypothetical protein Q8L64_02675 [bacterium]|nr:hypothetical protein [bacterium]